MAFFAPSPMELMMIAVIALIVLGPSRLPEAVRSLGKGMREMRDAFQGAGRDDDDDGGSDRPRPDDPFDEPGGDGGDASFEELEGGGANHDAEPGPAGEREGVGASERSP